MNLIRDLQKQFKEKRMKESAVAQLRKAEKNILSTDKRMQQI